MSKQEGLTEAGSYQNSIQQESCCRCCFCLKNFSPRGTLQIFVLKAVFVHLCASNSMGPTPGAVYTSESLLSDGGGWKEKKDTMWKWSLSANVLRLWQGSLSKPPFWKALKINNHWPKSILPIISHITWHSPAEVHKPLNYIPNIPSAGLSNFECVVSEISLRALDKQAPNNWTSWLN